MTIRQAANKSGLSTAWIRTAIWEEKLKAEKINGQWFISEQDFTNWRSQIELPAPTLEA